MRLIKLFILQLCTLLLISPFCFADESSSVSHLTALEKKLVNFVYSTVDNLHYSSYKFGGTHFDSNRGIYVVDCSNYVDNILRTVVPHAYSSLVYSTGVEKPNSQHYYDFFTELNHQRNNYWNKINEVAELEPGDILVFRDTGGTRKIVKRKRHGKRIVKTIHTRGQGHVMVVMNKPVFDTDSFLVKVADSAPSGHSSDTRSRHVSGIGIGTLLLKVNPKTGSPKAYAWKEGSCWKNNVKFAMARPTDSPS